MRTPRLPYTIVLLLALCLVPAFAAGAGPVGSDIPVTADAYAYCAGVAMGAGGDFEVLWSHYFTYSHPVPQGIFVRHFDREGRPTEEKAIRLDSRKSIDAGATQVVALPGRGYFVVWSERRLSEEVGTTFGRFLDEAGRPRGPVLQLARFGDPVAVIVVGDDLIVARREGDEILRARRFDFDGKAHGKVMLLLDNTRFFHSVYGMDLAPLADSFVAAWERWDGRSLVIEAQRFSLKGERLGPVLRLNDNRAVWLHAGVRVASDGKDRFAAAWTKSKLITDPQTGQQVIDSTPQVRFFDAGGASTPATDPTQAHTGSQLAEVLAMDGSGLALATWSGAGRFLDASGQPASEAFPLSGGCSAATSGSGEWVVTWHRPGVGTGIFARRLVFRADSAAGE